MTYEQEMREAEARGRAIGKAEGKIEEKIKVAENLIRLSIPLEVVAQSTELPLEEVQEIAAKLKK